MQKWILFLFFMMAMSLSATESSVNGTLIVTYQTGAKGERIDRIRFYLIDEKHAQQMYPKKTSFLEASKSLTKTVVIEDLPPGKYFIEFLVPNRDNFFKKVPQREIIIEARKILKLDQVIQPRKEISSSLAAASLEDIQFSTKPMGFLSVESNLPEARWILFNGDKKIHVGKGSELNREYPAVENYRVKGELKEGYLLKIDPEQTFNLERGRSFQVKINYERKFGFVDLFAALPNQEIIEVQFTSLDQDLAPMKYRFQSEKGRVYWRSDALPTGKYLVSFKGSSKFMAVPDETIEIIHGHYTFLEPSFVEPRSLEVVTNHAQALFLLKKEGSDEEWQGKGKEYHFKNLLPGNYRLSFATLDPDYLPPSEVKINITDLQNAQVKETYEIKSHFINPSSSLPANPKNSPSELFNKPVLDITQEWVNVNGDEISFSIGKYEVTNGQFANWLNQALKNKSIQLIMEGPSRGEVRDLSGQLLFKTWDKDSNSQITISQEKGKEIVFIVMPGKERYPVIFVTYFGAEMYAKDFHARLPTEKEWEIAAAWKAKNEWYLYGVSQNEMDRTVANYGVLEDSIIHVRTREVGFFNGINKLPLEIDDNEQELTQNAKSPFGAYDMSGNVWEWVQTGLVKGGSYASPAEELEIKRSVSRQLEHADAFTGFRVIKIPMLVE